MKVVIFCGGIGYRLREETEFKPKPMVEIGGKPILWHIMKIYSHYGHNEFILPLGYKGDLIKEFFIEKKWRINDFTLDSSRNLVTLHKDNTEEDWIIHFVDTGLESGTALRLYKIRYLLGKNEEFLLTYGDGVSDINLDRLIEFHRRNGGVVTITGVRTPTRFGIIKENEGKIESFSEKEKIGEYINGGFMVVSESIFDYLSDNMDEKMMFERVTLPKLAENHKLFIYKHEGFWHCMDTYRDFMTLNEMWNKGDKPWAIWKKKNEINLGNGTPWEFNK